MAANLVLTTLLLALALAAPAEDEVTELKGYYAFQNEFKMYSGYLTIQQSPLINIHYIFTTSKNKPETDDVVLWLNGGPGCSGLLGFMQELGPHLMHQGTDTLASTSNPYSWNNNANVIFFESPPGVGFSINEDPNYEYNDTRTAADNLIALQQWFKRFPEFSSNKFWITGQSYAGMFISFLTNHVLDNIDKIIPQGKLNFQGIMIGNGIMVTEMHWRRQAKTTFYSRHYFYGPQIQALLSNCHYNSSDDTNYLCQMGLKLAGQSTKRINPYNSIGICYLLPASQNGKRSRRFWYSAFDEQMYNLVEDEPGCSSDDSGLNKYFNQPEVPVQLHVRNVTWASCNDTVAGIYNKNHTVVPLYEKFKAAGLRILLYSGNVDAQVSYVETQQYIKWIGWPVTKPKTKILNPRGSLQGWVTVYDGLTFYVINAAGHMVPTDKPNAAFKMFENFRKGTI